ncbi:MAG: aerial mycelium formation protein [Actinomycetota bacterium]|nr:aerial mycelium formation protein [Actinomycetota bacterium]
MPGIKGERRRRIDQILDLRFQAGLPSLSLDELRERRRLCDEVETELSFYRRLLHGRMDLLAFELRRRRGEESRSLIEALPEILAAGERGSGRIGRLPQVLAPDLPLEGRRHIDRVLADDFLARLPQVEEEELQDIQSELAEVESEVSGQRRSVQQVFDLIQAEITRRYKEGRADVEQLLDQP